MQSPTYPSPSKDTVRVFLVLCKFDYSWPIAEIIKRVRWMGWWKVAVLGVAEGCDPRRWAGDPAPVCDKEYCEVRELGLMWVLALGNRILRGRDFDFQIVPKVFRVPGYQS